MNDGAPGRVRGRTDSRGSLLALAVLLLASVLVACSCTRTGPADPVDGPTPGRSADGAHDIPYAMLEGLVFVREKAIWTIENGSARVAVEADGTPWSLRDSRTGDAITYVSLAGRNARVRTALKGDWRAETIWETATGSMLVEVVHDDVADVLWFSASGEQTTTIGVRNRVTGGESALSLPVEISPYFSVRYEDGSLIAAGSAQEPSVLYIIGREVHPLFEAATLFSPRLSPDGANVLVTGAVRSGTDFRLWNVNATSGSATELGVGPGVPVDPVWSRDGACVAFRDTSTNTVWVVPAGGGPATNTGLPADEGGLAW
jgi:hypothetical protein